MEMWQSGEVRENHFVSYEPGDDGNGSSENLVIQCVIITTSDQQLEILQS